MRHSTWTPFLVPLALPLVLLCIPGTSKPEDTQVPAEQPASEYLLDDYQEMANFEITEVDPILSPGPKA